MYTCVGYEYSKMGLSFSLPLSVCNDVPGVVLLYGGEPVLTLLQLREEVLHLTPKTGELCLCEMERSNYSSSL